MSWSRFEGRIEAQSPKAILFQCHYWDAPMWLPLSQIKLAKDGDLFYVVDVRDWLTEKRGIMEFTSYTSEQMEQFNGAS